MSKYICFILLVFTTYILRGQTLGILQNRQMDTVTGLSLRSDACFYFLNNEYFNANVPGRTLLGNRVELAILYGKGLHYIRAGALAQLEYGAPLKVHWFPIFTLHYALSPTFSCTMGALGNGVNHYLPEQILGNETALTDPIEYGTQFTFRRKNIGLDSWLDWRQLENPTLNISEQFTQGNRVYFVPYDDSFWSVKCDAGVMFYHTGGQGLTTWKPTYTHQNYFAELMVNYIWDEYWKGTIKYAYLGFRRSKKVQDIPWSNGDAQFLTVNLQYKGVSGGLVYYKSNRYYAPYAGDIFSAGNFDRPNNDLLYGQIQWSSEKDKFFQFGVGSRIYYHTDKHKIDYSYYIILNAYIF